MPEESQVFCSFFVLNQHKPFMRFYMMGVGVVGTIVDIQMDLCLRAGFLEWHVENILDSIAVNEEAIIYFLM